MSSDVRPAVRRWVDAVDQPWRNGGGVTRELAISTGRDGDVDWRISIAEVTASGPFSLFPGVDRKIVLLDGPELTLTVGGVAHPLVRFRPFGFDGGDLVTCAVPAGPTHVLNVMTRAGRCRAAVSVVDVDVDPGSRTPGSSEHLVVPLADPVTVTLPAGDPLTLDRFDLYPATPAQDLVLSGTGPVALIEIHPVGSARTRGASTGS